MQPSPEPIPQTHPRPPPQPTLAPFLSSGISYSPLNEDVEEIRLLSILPYLADSGLVQCQLVTVSMKSFARNYQEFLARSGGHARSKRNTVADWTGLHHHRKLDTMLNSTIMDRRIPTREDHRFTWGDYAALSYVWGDTSFTRPIMVNNREMRVGLNLEVALRALSKRNDFEDGFMLWVDALCINQNDPEERGCQVNRMREIYGGAWTVIAWLGEEENNSRDAVRLVQYLSDVPQYHGEELAARLSEDPEYLGDGCWMALQEFMNRGYWYRLWIIQEIVLGSSVLVLRCGDCFIDWSTFCQGIGMLFDYLWMVKDDLLLYELRKRESNRRREWTTTSLHLVHQDLWALSHCEEQSRAYLRFDRLLNVANAADCRDPRDKVYGLVGMMDPIIANQLIPNYESHPGTVYASVAKTFMLTYGNLEPLREGNPWGRFGNPSWAADWTWNGRLRHRSPEKNDLWGPFWTRKGPAQMVEAAPPYLASGDTVPNISFSDNDLHLTCQGFIIDKIAGLSARGKGYFEWSEESIFQPQQENNMYQTIEGVSKAVYLALVADRVAYGAKANERHAAIFNLPSNFATGYPQFQRLGWDYLASQEGYYFRWQEWRYANRNFNIMGQPLDDYFSDEIPDGASEYDYTEVYSCVDRTCKGRRFMTTAKGYLGWAPDNIYGDDDVQTKKDDFIAIIFGCSTPIVIRPMGKYFQVVGEAYVQGLMDGKGLEFLDNGDCSVRDFTFC